MRTITTLALALLLAACGASDDGASYTGTSGAPPPTVEDAAPTVTATWRGEGNVLEFTAWEMSCSGCESTIQKRIGAIEGVTSVEADKQSAVVKVELADGADRGALTRRITEALESPESGKTFEIIKAAP